MRPGQILGGRYRVEDVLGAGGMGTVVSARALRGGQRVALKLPHPHAADRLVREARATARLTSPHAVKLVEDGELDGVPYLAFEYLDGIDLAHWLRTHGTLAPAAAAAIAVDACRALAEAHALGLVHRDLKPSNLFLTADRVVVIDFGAARDEAATTTGALGSPAYMAPEQLRPHAPADPRGDVWAIGVVLYELITGQRPFAGDELPALCLAIMLDDPAPLDGPIWPIIARCLAKDPDARFADAAALLAALAPHAVPRAFTADEIELEPAPPPRRRSRWLAAIVAVAAVAIAVAALASTSATEPAARTAVAPVIPAPPTLPVVAAQPPAITAPLPTPRVKPAVISRRSTSARSSAPPPNREHVDPPPTPPANVAVAPQDPLASPF